MKKLLLLSVLALCSAASMAVEKVSLSTAGFTFKTESGTEGEGFTVNNGQWGCYYEYDNWGTSDLSAYSQVVLVAEAPTEGVWFQVMVNNTNEKDVTDKKGVNSVVGENIITVDLVNCTEATQIYVQYGEENAEVKVKEFYLVKKSDTPTPTPTDKVSFKDAGFTFKAGSGIEGEGFTNDNQWGCFYEYDNWDGVDMSDYSQVVLVAEAPTEGVWFQVMVNNTNEKDVTDKKGVNSVVGENKITVDLVNCTEATQIYIQYGEKDATVKVKEFYLVKKSTALKPVINNAELVNTEYFSLTGTKSKVAQKGFNIIRRTFSDGSVVTEKALIK